MLASVVNSDKAIDMNVAIVRAFIGLKQLATNQNIKATDSPTIQKIMERLSEHDVQLSQIYDAIENLLDEKTEQKTWENRERIGFKK
jgi:phage regulator Rha-like protein